MAFKLCVSQKQERLFSFSLVDFRMAIECASLVESGLHMKNGRESGHSISHIELVLIGPEIDGGDN